MGARVSVIIPAYNAQDYIARAITSVCEQTFQDFELIVVDDRSTDSTEDVVRRLSQDVANIKLLKNEGIKGPSGARNLGLKHARGEYLAFLDADDIWLPNHLEKGINFLDKHREVSAVFFNFNIICDNTKKTLSDWFSEKKFLKSVRKRTIDKEYSLILDDMYISLLKESFIQLQSFIVRSRFCQNVYFDERIMRGEDLAFVIALYQKSKIKIAYSGAVTSNYYRHHDSLTTNTIEKATLTLKDHICLFSSFYEKYADSDEANQANILLNNILYDRHMNLSYCLRKQKCHYLALVTLLKSFCYKSDLQQVKELAKIMISFMLAIRSLSNGKEVYR